MSIYICELSLVQNNVTTQLKLKLLDVNFIRFWLDTIPQAQLKNTFLLSFSHYRKIRLLPITTKLNSDLAIIIPFLLQSHPFITHCKQILQDYAILTFKFPSAENSFFSAEYLEICVWKQSTPKKQITSFKINILQPSLEEL